jgi:hypothetical protein
MKRAIATLAATIGMMFVSVSAQAVPEEYGYDVSWPQCSTVGSLPTDGSFEVVGVNNGIVFTTNACLQSQLTWAGQDAELYLNTGNPGPNLSARYTSGSVAGKTCYSTNKNSTACAFLYGYRAARDSYERAQAAFTSLGWSNLNSRTWWLDVERVNSWRGLDGNLPSDNGLTSAQAQALNVANIQGSVYYLESVVKVRRLGIYSVTSHWAAITGATKAFSDHETWMAVGQDGEQAAINQCVSQPGFTGGPETRVQYIDTVTDLDVNVPCAFTKTGSVTNYSGTKTVARNRTMTLRATLKTALGTAMANQLVSIRFNGKTYLLTTNSSGNASKSVTAPKYRGNYKVTMNFGGNEIIASSSKAAYVKLY